MTLWGVRSGKYGERESLALDQGLAVIGWEELPNLTGLAQREELKALLLDNYPNEKPKTLSNWESQLWPFLAVMQAGEPIVMPLKQRSGFAIGRIGGDYHYVQIGGEYLHTRPVEWVKEVPRSALAQDLQYSFGAFLTVFQVYRNDAESRVKAVLDGRPDPVLAGGHSAHPQLNNPIPKPDVATADWAAITINVEGVAEDAIQNRIGTVFKGHKLSALVAAILEAQGYRVVLSPPGADGGVDIVAGRGPLGFDPPRLVVQVKSQDSSVDVSVLRELQGVMKQFNAEQGLLVAWGGVTKALAREAQRLFFEIRLWDANDVVGALKQHYEHISEDMQADLPLKRIWVLADSE